MWMSHYVSFLWFCNKLPQALWLKITQIDCQSSIGHKFLIRLKSRLGGSREESFSFDHSGYLENSVLVAVGLRLYTG